MKSIDEAEAQARLDEILTEVQDEPIVIQRKHDDIAILLSMPDYERLRFGAVRAFLDLRNDIAREASAAGLTEERLSQLLREK